MITLVLANQVLEIKCEFETHMKTAEVLMLKAFFACSVLRTVELSALMFVPKAAELKRQLVSEHCSSSLFSPVIWTEFNLGRRCELRYTGKIKGRGGMTRSLIGFIKCVTLTLTAVDAPSLTNKLLLLRTLYLITPKTKSTTFNWSHWQLYVEYIEITSGFL